MQIYKNLSLDNLPGEEWKAVAIPGYENKYLCSNLGRIKSLPKIVTLYHGGTYFTNERIIKQRLTDGYLFVALFNGKNETRLDIQAHRVIAITWVPNTFSKKEVNHKFGDKLDNRASELEWNTHSENVRHGYDNGYYNRRIRKVQCTCTGRVMFPTEAAKELGVSKTHMWAMLRGEKQNWTQFIYI